MNLGKYLKECRINKGLSQKDVADQMKYSTSQFVSNWERGISKPTFKEVSKISAIIGADAKMIYGMMREFDVYRIDLKYKKYLKR